MLVHDVQAKLSIFFRAECFYKPLQSKEIREVFFSSRAKTIFLARSERSKGVSFDHRARPPFWAPSFASAIA